MLFFTVLVNSCTMYRWALSPLGRPKDSCVWFWVTPNCRIEPRNNVMVITIPVCVYNFIPRYFVRYFFDKFIKTIVWIFKNLRISMLMLKVNDVHYISYLPWCNSCRAIWHIPAHYYSLFCAHFPTDIWLTSAGNLAKKPADSRAISMY